MNIAENRTTCGRPAARPANQGTPLADFAEFMRWKLSLISDRRSEARRLFVEALSIAGADVKVEAVRKWEQGRHFPDSRTLESVSAALGYDHWFAMIAAVESWVKGAIIVTRTCRECKATFTAASPCHSPSREFCGDDCAAAFDDRQKENKRIKARSSYESMLSSQGGVCAICLSPPSGKRLSVDHCHKTGAIRGLLCNACNTAIGFAKDSPGTLRAAAKYIEQYIRN